MRMRGVVPFYETSHMPRSLSLNSLSLNCLTALNTSSMSPHDSGLSLTGILATSSGAILHFVYAHPFLLPRWHAHVAVEYLSGEGWYLYMG